MPSLKPRVLRLRVVRRWNHKINQKMLLLCCYLKHFRFNLLHRAYKLYLLSENGSRGEPFWARFNIFTEPLWVLRSHDGPLLLFSHISVPPVKKVCRATVGVHLFTAQIFDLSPPRRSVQSELPPYEVIPQLPASS